MFGSIRTISLLMVNAIVTPQGKQAIGFVCPESIEQYRLDLSGWGVGLRIASPTIEVLPPLRIQHDLDDRIREARVYLEEAIDPRTLRFPEGTIARADIVAGEKVAQVQVTEILRVQKNQGYSPSRSELRDWYLAVKEQGDEEGLGRIEAIGRRLNDAYCDEVGAERAAIGQPAWVQTPIEFRSDLVTITAVKLGEMRGVISQRTPLSSSTIQIAQQHSI
jgi:hypothetical protein